MDQRLAFCGAAAGGWLGGRVLATGDATTPVRVRRAVRGARPPAMIQTPDADGPPDLAAFYDQKARSVGTTGAPICIGTGRSRLDAYDGDADATVRRAIEKAQESLSEDGTPQLCHITVALDVDIDVVASVLREKLAIGDKLHIIGRSVNKKESDGVVEVVLLRSDDGDGMITTSKTVTSSATDDEEQRTEMARNCAKDALEQAAAKLGASQLGTFVVFAHSPLLPSAAVRDGLQEAMPGVIAYGGPAVGAEATGLGWSFLDLEGNVVREDSNEAQVSVSLVPGSINFLMSSVVKNWVQPQFTEPLSYMTPTYVDDPSIDLLTAIRYDDWEKFIWCIEDSGVDVNVKWTEKQNQSPLLAACARARTRMIKYLIQNGADVQHRNAGNFTAAMYTRKLTEYDPKVVLDQLKALEDAGLDTNLSEEDEKAVKASGDGRIFLDRVE